MKKSFSSTLILTVIFGLGLGWYLLWEKKFRPERDKKADQAKELIQFEPQDLQEILVERAKLPTAGSKEAKGASVSYEKLHFKKVNNKWMMVEPVTDPGDDSAIQNLATTATTTKYDDIVRENVEDWKPYGLDNPKIKITVLKDANTKSELWVGDDTPVGYSTYVRKPDSKTLYQTARALRTSYERKVEDLRQRQILNWTRQDVSEMEIHNSHGEVLAKHGPDDKWTLVRQDLPMDDSEWNKALNATLELRATAFASDTAKNLASFGLNKPFLTILLNKSGSQEKLSLSIGKVKDKYYAKRADRDTVFEIAKDIVEKSDRPASAFLDRSVAKFNRFQTKRILIEHAAAVGSMKPKESVELVKTGPDWTVPSDTSARIAGNAVDAFLTALQDLKLTEYVASGPGKAAMRLVLYEEKTQDGKKSEVESTTLSFGSADSKTVLGGRAGLPKGFKIKESDFKGIHLGKADFLDKSADEQKAGEKKEASSQPTAKETQKKPNS